MHSLSTRLGLGMSFLFSFFLFSFLFFSFPCFPTLFYLVLLPQIYLLQISSFSSSLPLQLLARLLLGTSLSLILFHHITLISFSRSTIHIHHPGTLSGFFPPRSPKIFQDYFITSLPLFGFTCHKGFSLAKVRLTIWLGSVDRPPI